MTSSKWLPLALVVSLVACDVPTGNDDNPLLSVDPGTLDFGTETESLNLRIQNDGTGELAWKISIPATDRAWIKTSMEANVITNVPDVVSVTIDRSLAQNGSRSVDLSVSGPDTVANVIVLAVIERPAVLNVDQTSLDFGATTDKSQIGLRNSGGENLTWQASTSQPWITITPETGSIAPGEARTVEISISREGQVAGDLPGTVTITSSGGVRDVDVRVLISDAGRLTLSTNTLEYGESLTSLQMEVSNTGDAPLDWSATSDQTWISLSPDSGTLGPGEARFVTVLLSRDGQTADLLGTIEFSSDAGDASVSVGARLPTVPLLSATPATLNFGAGTNRLNVTLQNIGGTTLEWSVGSSDSWLVPLTTSGAILAGDTRTIVVEVSRSDLSVSTHQGKLTFSTSGNDVTLDATVTVQAAPELGLSSNSIEVSADEDGFVLRISNAGTGTLNWVATQTSAWLSIDNAEGSTSDLANVITGTVSRQGLTANEYSTKIFVTSDGGNGEILVTMSVAAPEVRFASGPDEEQSANSRTATFELAAKRTSGAVEFSTRLDGGQWSAWSEDPFVSYGGLEESSSFGLHEIEARARTFVGESAVATRFFSVDALQGPSIRIAPSEIEIDTGERLTIQVVLEEVSGVLGGNVILIFDPEKVSVTDVSMSRQAGSLVEETPQISPFISNEDGRLVVGFAAPGLDTGINGTGAIIDLVIVATSNSSIAISGQSTLRDLANQDIPLTIGAEARIQVSGRQGPSSTILSPIDALQVEVGTVIQFEGVASDPEDGPLEGSSLVWSSDIDGQLGIGAQLRLSLTVGSHRITLAATDSDQNTTTTSITLAVQPAANAGPTANAGANKTGQEGDAISFDGSRSTDSDGIVASYLWTFGDGTSSAEASVSHVFADDGNYSVRLTVTDDSGAQGSDTIQVAIQNVAPVARTHGPYAGTVGEPIQFSGSVEDPGINDSHTFAWDFGDGTSGIGPGAEHTFNAAGDFNATLTVTDNDGGIGTDSAPVRISSLSSPEGTIVLDVPWPQIVDAGTIAFSTHRNRHLEIYTVESDGSTPQQVIPNDSGDGPHDSEPAWSPDKSQICFVRSNRIYVVNVDGSDVRPLTDGYDYSPAWSPDGTRIAFVSDRDGSQDIFIMDADGTNEVNLTNDGPNNWRGGKMSASPAPAWSPDGSQIVFSSLRSGNWDLYVVSAAGGRPSLLLADSSEDLAPSWAPNGEELVFASNRKGKGQWQIFKWRVGDPAVVNISNSPYADTEPVYSRDGSRILFTSNRTGGADLYIMQADGSQQTRVTLDPEVDDQGAW
ncbi:MAG: PKD domain-containing protein [Candidatus Latescibacteria bacterium]|jgi:PKD repeat protein|nr:PKD domain-containing protein [Candidatus Latescibacterota bacterium]